MWVSRLFPEWRLWLTSAVGAVLCATIPPGMVTLVSQELIALFGLLLAGALPTMILTATILRAGAFSPKRVGDYAKALDSQLSFWFGLFIWALLACVAIMLSKALWNEAQPYSIHIPAITIGNAKLAIPSIPLVPIANVMLGVAGAQVAYRLLPMLAGLRSLLRLNSEIAKEEAADKVRKDFTPGRQRAAAITPTEGHGQIVE